MSLTINAPQLTYYIPMQPTPAIPNQSKVEDGKAEPQAVDHRAALWVKKRHVYFRKRLTDLVDQQTVERQALVGKGLDNEINKPNYALEMELLVKKQRLELNAFRQMRSKQAHDKYKCIECCYTNKGYTPFREHLRKHYAHKAFKCYKCGYAYYKRDALDRHLKTHLKPIRSRAKPPQSTTQQSTTPPSLEPLSHELELNAPTEQFRCTQCSYVCYRKQYMHKHIRIHHGPERRFQCPECDYSSPRKDQVKSHMTKHTGIKPFNCVECPFGCNSRADMEAHMRKHTGEKPFKCADCDKEYKTRKSLKYHNERVHYKFFGFKCKQCDFVCVKWRDIHNHVRISNHY